MQQTGREQLASYMDRSRMTQKELADKLGISRPYTCQIMLGNRRPSLPLAMHIEAETGVPARSWLLPERGSRKKIPTKSHIQTAALVTS